MEYITVYYNLKPPNLGMNLQSQQACVQEIQQPKQILWTRYVNSGYSCEIVRFETP